MNAIPEKPFLYFPDFKFTKAFKHFINNTVNLKFVNIEYMVNGKIFSNVKANFISDYVFNIIYTFKEPDTLISTEEQISIHFHTQEDISEYSLYKHGRYLDFTIRITLVSIIDQFINAYKK